MKKTYILDTNVLLHDPRSLFAFEDNEIVIPLAVLDELDKKKQGYDETAKHARMVIRSLDKMRSSGILNEGIKTAAGGTIRVELNHRDKCPSDLDPSRVDNRLIGAILGIQSEQENQVILVTKDISLRVKCDALSIKAEDYNADSVAENVDSIYEGVKKIEVDSELIDTLYRDGRINCNFSLYPNQYVQLVSNINPQHSSLAKAHEDGLIKVKNKFNVWGIIPRNREQVFAFDALFDPNIKIVTMTGSAGTGKTLISAAAGISQLLDTGLYSKLIMTRPIQPLGKDIGFLPGDLNQKMMPWIAPLQDNLELLFSEKGLQYLDMYKDKGQIEVEALTYIRGRSIPNSYIIIDEAQNLSLHEVKTIITRVGEGSKIILTGDIMQIDNPYIDSVDNGLSCIIEKFKEHSIAAHITLQKGERSELASLAADIL